MTSVQPEPAEKASEEVAGYAHPAYAQSLAEFGVPLPLGRSGGHLISRPLPLIEGSDASGSYPLFACREWHGLAEDLHDLQGELASVAMVIDPFAELTEPELRRCFRDRVAAFKQHHVIDLSHWTPDAISDHHRRRTGRALARVTVDRVVRPDDALDDWCALYSTLIDRHAIRGIARFSRTAFRAQLRVPGLVAFRARERQDVVGMTLWYVWRGVAYYHLGAYSRRGYQLGASYAVMASAIECFARRGEQWIDLGGGAGTTEDRADGLTYFKQGWATGTRPAYFCGRILNRELYEEATRATRSEAGNYFPHYRAGEVR